MLKKNVLQVTYPRTRRADAARPDCLDSRLLSEGAYRAAARPPPPSAPAPHPRPGAEAPNSPRLPANGAFTDGIAGAPWTRPHGAGTHAAWAERGDAVAAPALPAACWIRSRE